MPHQNAIRSIDHLAKAAIDRAYQLAEAALDEIQQGRSTSSMEIFDTVQFSRREVVAALEDICRHDPTFYFDLIFVPGQEYKNEDELKVQKVIFRRA